MCLCNGPTGKIQHDKLGRPDCDSIRPYFFFLYSIHYYGLRPVARVGAVCKADRSVPDPPGFRVDLLHKNTLANQSSFAHVGARARRRDAVESSGPPDGPLVSDDAPDSKPRGVSSESF